MKGAILAILCMATVASAQGVDRRYAEEPTDGVDIPTTPLAGEHDARAVTYNPGGLALLRGWEAAAALTVDDPDVATSSGAGFGLYGATGFGGELIPHFAVGLGLEWLRPPRAQVEPDPGQPFRSTIAAAMAVSPKLGIGVSWHHFHADGILAGVDTFDAGASWRVCPGFALGGTVRDIATNPIGGTPVQRRYELEALFRPLSTDRLEVALGGRLGETREDFDGWGRVSLRFGRGAVLHAMVETRALHVLEDTATGVTDTDGRDVRATVGLELSFGRYGATALGTGLRDDADQRHAFGGTFVARASEVGPASVLGERDHIERIELEGTIDARALTTIVLRMRAIARDPHVVGLVVTFNEPIGGWSTFEELRSEVVHVRQAHKKVYAYMVSGTARDYLVASAADKIYVDPGGGLRLVGVAGTTLYFRGTFDLLGITPQFEKIAEYKSAPEEFTEIGPTPTAAKMHAAMLDSIWDHWLDAVGTSRHLTKQQLQAIVDNGPYTADELARDTKLVDGVGPPDKISEWVLTDLGGVYPVDEPSVDRPDAWQRPNVAVIYIDGDITDGKSQSIPLIGQKTAGGETLVAAVAAAREDKRIGAIVLRIDSPGGSALASELIAREVFATRGVKPIICSMSDYAASGGYFVAAGCDKIFAEPTTITGSIGIFFGKFDVSGLMKKLGVSAATDKRGARADVETMYRPYSDEERAVLLDKLRYSYSRFVGAVAEGRGMSKDDVDANGRGHVWTGAQALPIKLVDQMGGIGDAIEEAKRRMKLSPDDRVHIVEIPEAPASLFGTLGKLVGLHAEDSAQPPLLKELLEDVPASMLVAPGSAQARLPFDLRWN